MASRGDTNPPGRPRQRRLQLHADGVQRVDLPAGVSLPVVPHRGAADGVRRLRGGAGGVPSGREAKVADLEEGLRQHAPPVLRGRLPEAVRAEQGVRARLSRLLRHDRVHASRRRHRAQRRGRS